MPNELATKTADIIMQDPLLGKVLRLLDKLHDKAPARMYLAGGCIAETIFNYIYNKPSGYGIKDLDILFYSETSTPEQEQEFAKLFNQQLDSNVPCDFKNQHTITENILKKWNIRVIPYKSVDESCTRWSLTATSITAYLSDNILHIHAPYGLDDMHNGILRATPRNEPPYFIGKLGFDQKTKSLTERWPELKVIPYVSTQHAQINQTHHNIPVNPEWLKPIKYQTLESDNSGDIAERRVVYRNHDYEDVTDFGELALYQAMQQQIHKTS